MKENSLYSVCICLCAFSLCSAQAEQYFPQYPSAPNSNYQRVVAHLKKWAEDTHPETTNRFEVKELRLKLRLTKLEVGKAIHFLEQIQQYHQKLEHDCGSKGSPGRSDGAAYWFMHVMTECFADKGIYYPIAMGNRSPKKDTFPIEISRSQLEWCRETVQSYFTQRAAVAERARIDTSYYDEESANKKMFEDFFSLFPNTGPLTRTSETLGKVEWEFWNREQWISSQLNREFHTLMKNPEKICEFESTRDLKESKENTPGLAHRLNNFSRRPKEH